MRYYVQEGGSPDITMMPFICGPKDESQVHEAIKTLFSLGDHVQTVSIVYDRGTGQKIEHYSKIKD